MVSHRRFNPLTGRWVLVSPQREQRPWTGAIEASAVQPALPHDPSCPLCPGVTRKSGVRNPDYQDVFVFNNDFAALGAHGSNTDAPVTGHGLYRAAPETGVCRVVCFSPKHDQRLGALTHAERVAVVHAWQQQTQALMAQPELAHVQIFENAGVLMGASVPHPHGQIWAQSSVPDEVAIESEQQRQHAQQHGACMLCEVVKVEQRSDRIVVDEDDGEGGGFVAFVPFWAVWPFELLLVPKQHCKSLPQLSAAAAAALARTLARIMQHYDALFQTPMPLTWGFHQSPRAHDADAFHLHAHFYPPLLRSSSVRKWMVGYEMLAEPQRDLTPEAAARRLRGESA